EQQQDANSALMELDKGLRAHKLGEQCEAIVRFPNLFSRFPFPILINSAFLKLADAFRTGNNFLKLCVLRVAQQSTKQLDKILNIDEFMRRIYSVIHSNDPYARAITLRMLGSVACVIKDKKNAHHSVQQGLDSHDRVEQDAAIYATIQFASHSHQFASSICNKIAAMLQGSTDITAPIIISLLELCRRCCYDSDLIQAALATKLFASISKHAANSNDRNRSSFTDEAIQSAETLLLTLAPSSETSAQDRRALKTILPTLQQLSESNSGVDVRIAEDIVCLLSSDEIPICSVTSKILLETLASIVTTSSTPHLLDHLASDLFRLLKMATNSANGASNTNAQKVATILCVLLFTSESEMKNSNFPAKILSFIETTLNNWRLYRIARQASRLGQHTVAHTLFNTISKSVSSEHHYFWLTGLADLSTAEAMISASSRRGSGGSNLKNLQGAIHLYHSASTSMMAAVTPNHPLTFQCEYARLRNETLQAHAQLLSACSLIRTCPPSAIAASTGGSKSGEQNEILVARMKSCSDWFMAVETGYSNLHMTSFDSDPKSLLNIDLLQQSCSIMAHAVDVLVLSRGSGLGSITSKSSSFDENALKKVTIMLEEVLKESSPSGPMSQLLTDCLVKCSMAILSVPLSFPRYFYQSLQTTSIKMDEGKDQFVQTVIPRNDYFSTQFLITFPVPGIYNLHIGTNVEDGDGVWWKTGAKETVLVKSFDDNLRIQQQAQQSQARTTP
uniref:Integrator complex subunit 7 n=1 Tax=Ciona savignyi TaxID=51511 RepID=H2ZCL6_CIOSA